MKRERDLREQARERFLDIALGESLSECPAPDVTTVVERLLANPAAREFGALRIVGRDPDRVSDGLTGRARVDSPRRRRRLTTGFGFLAGAVAGWLLVTLPTTWSDEIPSRVAVCHVLEGLGHRTRDVDVMPCRPRVAFHVATGDRITSSPLAPLCLQISPLGVLRFDRQSEIEILAMNWKDFGGGAALGSVTIAVIAGVVQWSDDSRSTVQAGAGERVELTAGDNGVDESDTALERKYTTALQRIRDLEEAASRTAAPDVELETPPVEPAGSPGSEEKPPARYRSGDEGLEVILDKVDWNSAGAASAKLQGLIEAALERLRNGEPIPMTMLAEISEVDTAFIKATMALFQADLPGVGMQGKYHQPMIKANMLDAHLNALGTPLSAAQRETIGSLAAQMTRESELRRAGYDENTPRLQKLLDEAALTERFCTECGYTLTPEQQVKTVASKAKGHTDLDQFGPGAHWSKQSNAVHGRDRAKIAQSITSRFEDQLGLDAEQARAFGVIASRWTRRFPEELWAADDRPSKIFGSLEMMRVARVQAAAKIQIGMIQDALHNCRLSGKQRRDLLSSTKVFVPYRRAK